MNADLYINNQRLYFDSHYTETAKLFCNLEGAKTTLTRERFLLGSWFEGYIYTALLGLKLNHRCEFKNRTDKAAKWSVHYMKQYKYLLVKILSKRDILNELQLLTKDSIVDNFKGTEGLLNELQGIANSFSNGGLEYLSELYRKDSSIFNYHDSLKRIYMEAGQD